MIHLKCRVARMQRTILIQKRPRTMVHASPVEGCTDSGACNYDVTANVDDGTCEFDSCGMSFSHSCNMMKTLCIPGCGLP